MSRRLPSILTPSEIDALLTAARAPADADNEKRVVFESVLRNRLDTLAVRDDAVFHNVKCIHVAPPAPEGHRIVILLDFTPLKPDIHINN